MPRKYIRKTEKAKWSAELMQQALDFIKEGNSVRSASKKFNIPKTSLNKRREGGSSITPRLGRTTIFTPEQEKFLAEKMQAVADIHCGLTSLEIRRIAYEFVEANNIPNSFSKELRMAGKDWLYGFLKRNPTLKYKKAEANVKKITGNKLQTIENRLSHSKSVFGFASVVVHNVDDRDISQNFEDNEEENCNKQQIYV